MARSFPGSVEVPRVCRREEKEEKDEMIRTAIEKAAKKELDQDTIWTDGSGLDDGRVGVSMAWCEEAPESERRGSVVISRRGFCTAGKRRERVGNTYRDRHRSFEPARSGWRTAGFGMG